MSTPSLASTDLGRSLSARTYSRRLTALQRTLQAFSHPIRTEPRSVVFVFEGWDASGKGGAIRRLTAPLDPRSYVVHPIAAPEGEDARRHYLYRFWRRLPEAGRVAIFDRSWYGRVLVERVEGFATRDEWQRAYGEIRDFERHLTDAGVVLFKFLLHISPEEQLSRFRSRETDARKQWKLTDEDWRNRERWDDYTEAMETMLAETHTPDAPWTVVAGDCKRHARVQVLQTVVDRLGDALEGVAPPVV